MALRSGLLFAYKGNHFFANIQISRCFFYLFREELGGFAVFSKCRISYFFGKEHIFFLMAFCQRQRTDWHNSPIVFKPVLARRKYPTPDDQMPLYWIATSNGDAFRAETKHLARYLDKQAMPYRLKYVDGRYNWQAWAPMLPEFLKAIVPLTNR